MDATALFTPYAHAIASLAGWALLVIFVNLLATAKGSKSATETGVPRRDYADQGYRAFRAQANAAESSVPFVAATLAAILVGAAPFWVNLLASVFLVARVAMVGIHVWTTNQPARSAAWFVASFSILGLIFLALWGAFTA